MLKIKTLQILGFKSFCDRTELKFHGEGVAAIVGPNGCGKSNLADAISWVLGEQSAKTLRGGRMEDVIFSGTRDRNPMGMAEVSLTLIDPEVYDGPAQDLSAETEVDVQDNLPADDWDEAGRRAQSVAEGERVTQEFQPGVAEEGAETETGAALDSTTGDSTTGDGTAGDGTAGDGTAGDGEQVAEADADAEAGAATEESGPLSEVVLRVRRRKLKQFETRAGQIVLTRRLFRSGESEYLINGKLSRLRDIQDIFLGTGLGPESYAIIEQGRIGQILSSRPYDRRAIIEEAAGITKFKTRKRLAEARLEQAQQNLARLTDIFEEVTRQMNSLKRQASKAERYVRLRDEMRAKLRLVLAGKFAQFAAESAACEQELASLSADMQTGSASVQQMEEQQSARTQRGYDLESAASAARERAAAITLETDRAQAQQHHNHERCRELLARSTETQVELEHTAAHLASVHTELRVNRGVLDSAQAEVAAAQQEAARREQQAAVTTASLLNLEQEQEQRRVRLLEALASASDARNQITQAEEQLAAFDRENRRLDQQIASAREEAESVSGQRGQFALVFESASSRVQSLQEKVAETRRCIAEKRKEEEETRHHLDGMRSSFAAALGKKNSMEALVAEHGYSTESVKRLMQSGSDRRKFAPVGVLADFLEVEETYERVVEDFLRDELNYIVVKSWDSADDGLRLLQGDADGRATFLVHPDDSQAKFSFVVDEEARPAPARDSLIPLTRCIRVLNGFGKSLEVILPKLREGYIASGPGLARDLALENPSAFFLSPSGECFHNVTVTGGKQRAGGPLSMKRELREVERRLDDLQQQVQNREQRVATLVREIREFNSLLERLDTEARDAERQAMTSGTTLERLDTDLARARERLATCEAELERLQAEREQTSALASSRRLALAVLERQRAALETGMSAALQQFEALKASREAAVRASGEMAVRVAALEERRTAAAAALGRIETLAEEVAARAKAWQNQMTSAASERHQREDENVELAGRIQILAKERSEVQQQEAALRTESIAIRARLSEVDQQLRAARLALDAARDRRGEVSALLARLASDTEHLAEVCLNELGATAGQLQAGDSLLRVTGEQLAAEDALYRDLRARLEGMGPVNMMALEEYNETSQRHAFLETQRKDLFESIENTQNTIREIDQFSRQRFQEAFNRINENFQLTFRKLFGGGHAFMRLTDEENAAESGIDVVASPPGKKLQNVLLLSGGEKALTAFALLVGIFQYQPSPFCILDEVDAPLDEANIGRFTQLVREMSVKTQFVIITHNRKTMNMAPVLYGVTMQEPG
ncbi:MAG: chromosome segregation protein SMC, partial [Terriglobales bacterium]